MARLLRRSDAAIPELIELAAVHAERGVLPHVAKGRPFVRGRSWVAVRFVGRGTHAAFARSGAIRRTGKRGVYVLRRRWAEAGGDAHLDEAMCTIVAAHLNDAFAPHLMAYVATILGEMR